MDSKERAWHLRHMTKPLDRPELHCFATDKFTGKTVWLVDRLKGDHRSWWACLMEDGYIIRTTEDLTDFRRMEHEEYMRKEQTAQ